MTICALNLKRSLVFVLMFLSTQSTAIAQANPCTSPDYLKFGDIPEEELRGASRSKKRKAEKACKRHKIEQSGNWKYVKELVVLDYKGELFLEGMKQGASDASNIRGGFGKGFLVGLLVSGFSTQLAFNREKRIVMIVSPLTSMLFAGLLPSSGQEIPSDKLLELSPNKPQFLLAYKTEFNRVSNKNYGDGLVIGALASSLIVTGLGLLAYQWTTDFNRAK